MKFDHGNGALLDARAETLAQAYCAAYEPCDCGPLDTVHADPAQCEANEKQRILAAFQQAKTNFGCSLYHGEVTNGICETVHGTPWSDCESGSSCDRDSCKPNNFTLGAEGYLCGSSSNDPSNCLPELYCDQTLGCQPVQNLGEPCLTAGDGSMRCANDLFCKPTSEEGPEGLCEARLTGGESCAVDQYACHGWCDAGGCVDQPAVCALETLRPPVSRR